MLFLGPMFFVTIGLLAWLIYRQKEALLSYHWEFRPVPIALSFVFYSLSLLQVSFIWFKIITALGNRLGFTKNFRYFSITNLGKRLPGSVWYIPWRARMYQEQGMTLRAVSIASGIELVVSVISGAIISLIFAAPSLGFPNKNAIGIFVVLVLMIGMLHPVVIRKISRLLRVTVDDVQYWQILQWVVMYAFFWITSGNLLFFVINIFIPLDITFVPYVIGVWTLTGVLSTLLLLLPSNMGMTEISLSVLLSVVIPSPVAVVVAIGNRVLLLFYEVIWAGISIWQEGQDSGK